jgi:hypothetical protein
MTPSKMYGKNAEGGDAGSDGDIESSATQIRGSLGIEGLSLDAVPTMNISRTLKKIADGLFTPLGMASFSDTLCTPTG